MKMVVQFSTLVLMLTAASCSPRDPVNVPPQWELLNAPKGMCIALQIAAFYGYPDRQRDCMIMVRHMRAQGIDAYCFNGETISSVCVGVWPMDAVDWEAAEAEMKQNPKRPELRIFDASLAKAIHDFPFHAINGVVHETEKDGVKKPDPSFVAFIPGYGCYDPTRGDDHNILPHRFDLSR